MRKFNDITIAIQYFAETAIMKKILPYLPITIIIAVLVWYEWKPFMNWVHGPKSPRLDDIHYITSGDSVYKVHYVIDSVMKKEYDPGEKEDNR